MALFDSVQCVMSIHCPHTVLRTHKIMSSPILLIRSALKYRIAMGKNDNAASANAQIGLFISKSVCCPGCDDGSKGHSGNLLCGGLGS